VKWHCWNGLSPLSSQACPAKMALPTWAFWPKAETGETASPTGARWLTGNFGRPAAEAGGPVVKEQAPAVGASIRGIRRQVAHWEG
jgi:hypothetical protein